MSGDYALMLSGMLVQAELIKESQQPLTCFGVPKGLQGVTLREQA